MTMRIPISRETGARFPTRHIWSKTRGLGRLFLRNLWRSGVMPLLPVVIAIGVWYTRLLIGEGVVLWSDVSVSIAMIYAIVGPLCAGLAAWSSGRSRRRHMDDQLRASALPDWQQELLIFLTAASIGVLGYAGTAIVVLGWASTEATWGFPYGVVILSGLCMVVLFSFFGAAVGMLWPNRMASLLVTATTGGSVALGNTIQNYTGHANARELTLWNTLLNLREGLSPWVSDRAAPELYENMLMATGLSVLVVTLTLAIRHRGPFFISVLLLTVIWAVGGVFATTTGPRSTHVAGWMASGTTASFDYDCDDLGVVEVCLHPAWNSRQSLIDEVAAEIFAPVAGLDGVPEKIVQTSTYDRDARGDDTFYMPGGRITRPNLAFTFVPAVFPDITRDPTTLSDAELVITGWLQEEAGGSAGMLPMLERGFQPYSDARRQAVFDAIDRFSALTPDQQRAWLEANWDALRNGELTLDDLP